MNRTDDAISVSKKLTDLVSQSSRISPLTPCENNGVSSTLLHTIQIAIQSRLPNMVRLRMPDRSYVLDRHDFTGESKLR
jgi:hypothetical protein